MKIEWYYQIMENLVVENKLFLPGSSSKLIYFHRKMINLEFDEKTSEIMLMNLSQRGSSDFAFTEKIPICDKFRSIEKGFR
jgi:hypothetical protein